MLDGINTGIHTLGNSIIGKRVGGHLHIQAVSLIGNRLQLFRRVHARSHILQACRTAAGHNLNPVKRRDTHFNIISLQPLNFINQLLPGIRNGTNHRTVSVRALDSAAAGYDVGALNQTDIDRACHRNAAVIITSHITNGSNAGL